MEKIHLTISNEFWFYETWYSKSISNIVFWICKDCQNWKIVPRPNGNVNWKKKTWFALEEIHDLTGINIHLFLSYGKFDRFFAFHLVATRIQDKKKKYEPGAYETFNEIQETPFKCILHVMPFPLRIQLKFKIKQQTKNCIKWLAVLTSEM